jgi:DNA-binding CsgD family transcriptional regulator
LIWRLDALNKFLLAASPVLALTPALGREACRALGLSRLAFLRVDCARRHAWAVTGWGIEPGALTGVRANVDSSPWIRRCVLRGKPSFTASARAAEAVPAEQIARFRLGPLLCVPLHVAGSPYAVMLLDRHGEPFAVDDLLASVAAAVGESISRALEAAGAASAWNGDGPASELTARQVQMLEMMGRGLSNKQIAHLTGLSVFTVRDHVSALLHKLDVTNRSAAVVRAWQLGLLREPAAVG